MNEKTSKTGVRPQPDETANSENTPEATTRLDGVVIGILIGFADGNRPLVVYPGNNENAGVSARSTAALKTSDIGQEVALLFEEGDPSRPLIVGKIQRPQLSPSQNKLPTATPTVETDGERLVLSADKEVVIRCGKASITLTRAGKVLLRGAYLLSRSSGVNRIKGGSVQLN